MRHGDTTLICHLVISITAGGDGHDVILGFAFFDEVPSVVKRCILCPVLEDWVAGQGAKSVFCQSTGARLNVIALHFCPCFLKNCSPDGGAIDTWLRKDKFVFQLNAFVCVFLYTFVGAE